VRGNEREESRAVTRGHAASPEVTIRSDQIRSEEIRSESLTRARVRPRPGRRPEAAPAPSLTLIDRDAPLSTEARAYAETLGVTSVEQVHRDFVDYHVSEAKLAADWEAKWRRWCSRELQIQRRDRDQNRGRRAPIQMDEPGAPRGWKMPEIHYAKRSGKPE
jgi:hypothetical protein